ncbi:SDR family NAD(P)-dependent oxidoreductase [Sporosarcina sp. PTS2304]|uniref:SDR family NAD(P)-dependent oxidoreductase n=1 Tax=Sporosarcina sp. PTS2304 TaxID=2283194 RepID=UPI000E0D3215|nr:glucose 1-dehydrogenase [Sporosarcina sp. PTS2304]AXH99549.1 SDR family NAD(P)-dependent oxidoreductase [Sporosarcina sp. PTS2304]
MFSFDGKVAMITGSTTGIGNAIARQFLSHGGKVVIHGYKKTVEDEAMITDLLEEGHDVLLVDGDVTIKKDVEKMMGKIEEHFGHIDILVNNVGAFVKKAKFEDIEEDDWERIIAVNLKSVFLVTQAALPLIKKQGEGRIINITSNVERTGGTPEGAAYAAAKGGVSSLTRSLAKQMVAHNILVNAVSPGLIDTPFHNSSAPLDSYEHIFSNIPLKRSGTADEIAGAVLYLASPYSSYVVGETIEVSGGRRIS